MGMIKNGLKKILPPPVNSFMREVNRIVALEEKNQAMMRELMQTVKQQEKKIEKQNVILEQQERQIAKQNETLLRVQSEILCGQKMQLKEQEIKFTILEEVLKQLQQNLTKKVEASEVELLTHVRKMDEKLEAPIIYNNNWERRAIESFRDITKREDFLSKYRKLVNGLDEESVLTIIQLLKRQIMVINEKDKKQSIYTKEEQEKIRLLKEDFDSYKLQLAENVFAYKQYLLPINHFEASVFYYKHGLDYIQDLDQLKNEDIIDVGGFIGDSCLILSPLTNRKVYTFEAVEENYELLLKTISLNHLENIVPEKLALGASDGEIAINVAGSCSSTVSPSAPAIEYQEKVKMTSLDSYLANRNDINVGLIKVDIEGAEQEFIKGAIETIRKHRPVLLLSIYHNADDFFQIKPMIENLNLGYQFKIYNPTDFSISREVLLIAQIT